MPILFEFSKLTLYRHAGKHLGHSDLQTVLHIADWQIAAGQRWAIVGGKEEQRSALLNALREHNVARPSPLRCTEISLLEQQRRIDAELLLSKTGVADEIFAGTLVADIVQAALATSRSNPTALYQQLLEQLQFTTCVGKHFRELSSGETRRLLMIVALLSEPELLLMHDPLEGLDSNARPQAAAILDAALSIHNSRALECSMFASSRPAQLPAHTTHLAYIDGDQLHAMPLNATRTLEYALRELRPLLAPLANTALPELPRNHPFHQHKLLDPARPLISMRQVCVRYADQPRAVLDKLDWSVYPLQHWRISGRNGSGKTTLLKLVTGDHPQVYQNDIEVCGFKRGSGESIWQVKRHIGYMSSEMLWNYRSSGQLAGKALNVVMSGLYDSIGLYAQASASDKHTAQQWLELFGMGAATRQRFQSLGLADQRLVLIARAMIKRPSLLILDEPLQGLDGDDRLRALRVVEQLVSSNTCTLLYVSHHDDECVSGIEHTLAL